MIVPCFDTGQSSHFAHGPIDITMRMIAITCVYLRWKLYSYDERKEKREKKGIG
jgi:hypothetical protein